ncbi:MAG TPA: methyltransferase domain-containing protein [Steroidobacteraceae bacterium]
MTDANQPQLAVRQFGDTAANYLSSSVHARGADLERLEQLARRLLPARALDLGCGAGHSAFALARGGAREVIAFDPSPPMLEVVAGEARARGLSAIQCRLGAAERLEFEDASFDLVATRFSAHHWSSVPSALREMARVLKPTGRLVVIDVMAPEAALLDTALQTLELLRDRSHVRNYRASEWQQMLASAGLGQIDSHGWKLPLEFDSWVRRIATSSRRIDALRAVIEDLPSEVRGYFAVSADGSFTIDAGWIEAVPVLGFKAE